jgi:hypothetical protein
LLLVVADSLTVPWVSEEARPGQIARLLRPA